MNWCWSLLSANGSPMQVEAVMAAEQRFPSQSEAETWIGESWPELLAAGVDSVVLLQGERVVYGPMGLRPGP